MVVSQRLGGLIAKENAADLKALAQLIESGAVTPHVGRTYPLEQAPDAIRHLANGHAAGKIAISL
jgi:NADPH:quinone reductase-like Zn-dependent oxidoreductase